MAGYEATAKVQPGPLCAHKDCSIAGNVNTLQHFMNGQVSIAMSMHTSWAGLGANLDPAYNCMLYG